MLFRVTQKLAKKIKIKPQAALPNADNPFLDWTANLFLVSRRQCTILTNSRSLYTVTMPCKGVTSEKIFVERAQEFLAGYFAMDGLGNLFDVHIAPHIGSVSLCKASDMRVLGSMTDFIHNVRWSLLTRGNSPAVMNMNLNDMPMGVIKYSTPREALIAMADWADS